MTQVSRQVLYGSSWTPFNGSDGSNPRPFSYWADLGFSDMLFWTGMPGMRGGPALSTTSLFGGASNGDYVFVANQAKAAGMNLILGCAAHGDFVSGAVPPHTPPFAPDGANVARDWLTDAAWRTTIVASFRQLARWAKATGHVGIFTDEEISSSNDGWTYAGYKLQFPASTLTQAQAEQAAYDLGKLAMQGMVAEFPDIEWHNYSASSWPGAWSAFWRSNYTITVAAPGTPSLQNWFYKGALSVVGYKHVYFWNADFYGGQYHTTASNTYVYNGKTYDSWQWGSTQFDRDGFKRFCFGPSGVAGGGFLDATTDPAKVDIVPFIAIAPIEPGSTNPNYQTKPLSTVTGQITPSINQRPGGQNNQPTPNGQPWHTEPAKPVVLVGHYAYGNEADVWIGTNPDGTHKLGAAFDYSPYRTALRDMVGVSAGPVTGSASFPVTVDGATPSGLLTINLS